MKSRIALAFILISLLNACEQPNLQQQNDTLIAELKNGDAHKSLILAKNLLRDALALNDEKQANDARLFLARSYFELGDYENSLRFYQLLDTDKPETELPEHTEVDDWHRTIFLALEQDDKIFAEKILLKAKALFNPYEMEIYTARIKDDTISSRYAILKLKSKFVKLHQGVLVFASNPKESIRIFEQLIKELPEFAEAYLYQARALQMESEFRPALASYIKFEKLKPTHPEAKLQVASVAIRSSQTEIARPYVEDLMERAPDAPLILQLRAALALHDNEYELAKQLSEQSIGLGLDSHMNRLVAGMSSFQLKQWEQANTHLRWISEDVDNNHPAKRMLIASKLALKEPQIALGLFQELDLQVSDLVISTELAKQLIGQGYLDSARQVQQKVAEVQHEISALKATYDSINQSIENNALKQRLMASIDNATASDQEWLNLVMLHLRSEELLLASKVVDEWLDKSPDNINALNAASTIAFAQGKTEFGEHYLAQASKIDNDNVPSLLYELHSLYGEKNWLKLEQRSLEFINSQPSVHRSVFFYWLESLYQNDTFSFAPVIKQVDDNPVLERTLLESLINKQHYELLNDYLYKRISKKSWQEMHWFFAIELSDALNQAKETEALLVQYLKKDYLNTLDKVMFAVNKSQKLEKYQLMLNAIEQGIKNIDPEQLNTSLHVPHVIALTRLNKPKLAFSILQQTKQKSPEFFEALYEYYLSQGDLDKAWQSLVNSVTANPMARKFAKLHTLATDETKLTLLKTLITELAHVSVGEVQLRTAASYWFISTDAEFTIKVLDVPSMDEELRSNFVLANNLAWLLNEKGDNENARKYATYAKDLAPDNEQVIDTYNKVFGL